MTEHTPGPWIIMPTLKGALSINVAPSVPVATVGGAGWHLGEKVARANARLIAAAPEMLAALEDALTLLPDYPAHDPQRHRVDTIRAAIAKAKRE
jgi:hypothetical protein